MHTLDVLYWFLLFLGAFYIIMTMTLSGVSHLLGSLGGSDATGHVDAGGEVGHADAGALDGGFDHAAEVGHLDAGDVGGHVGHADAGGVDAGDAGGDVGHTDAGDAAHADHGTHHGHSGGANLLAFLNPTMLSGFFIGFGGGGVLSRVSGAGALPSLACAGLGGGLLYAYVRWLILRVFVAANASSHTRSGELVGRTGTVGVAVGKERTGMVTLIVGGSRESFRALSDSDETIPAGAEVRVRAVNRGTLIVTRVRRMDKNTGEGSVTSRSASV